MASFRKAVIAAILKSLLRGKSLIQAILAYWVSPLVFDETKKGRAIAGQAFSRTIQDFLKEAETDLLGPISGDGLNDLSVGLKRQFLERLQSDLECMLPSYNHQLPTGQESGQFLALDVGGSTLRVALVELSGRSQDGQGESRIVSMRNFKIDKVIKDLEGTLFFDWMAARISETLSSDQREKAANPDEPLPIALAWSFPIE
jgi:hexokinase